MINHSEYLVDQLTMANIHKAENLWEIDLSLTIVKIPNGQNTQCHSLSGRTNVRYLRLVPWLFPSVSPVSADIYSHAEQ